MIIRFATFNIRTGRAFDFLNSWPLRRRSTGAAIEALDVDVLGLQEVYEFQRRYLARVLPGHRWVGLGRNTGDSGEHCSIAIADREIEIVATQTKWFGDTPGGRLPRASAPRIVTLLRCRRGETVFDVANTHLDERHRENRATSVRQLVGWLDPSVPTVVMGDLNADPDDPVLRPLVDEGLHRVQIDGGTAHSFSGRVDGRQIDHIFVSSHWTVADAGVMHGVLGGRLPSDHWPVFATLRLGE